MCKKLKTTDGYSKRTLQPLNPEIAALYREYTRAQVRDLIPWINILFGVMVVLNLAIAIKEHDFKQLRETVTPIIVFFFLILGIFCISFICYAFSKKWSVAIEFF